MGPKLHVLPKVEEHRHAWTTMRERRLTGFGVDIQVLMGLYAHRELRFNYRHSLSGIVNLSLQSWQ